MSKIRLTNDLDAETLRAHLDYNPETGKFYHGCGACFGKESSCLTSRGYIKVRVGKKYYLAHRLAWLYVHGVWPPIYIDHINGIPTDNRIVNLRPATPGENSSNRPAFRARHSLATSSSPQAGATRGPDQISLTGTAHTPTPTDLAPAQSIFEPMLRGHQS